MSEYEHWILTQEDRITTLTLNRPESKNNLTAETLHELHDAITRLRENKDVWVVVIKAVGRHFSTGMDIDAIRSKMDESEQAIRAYLADQQRCMDELEALEKPVVAQLHGFCIGGGLLLALCCDFRIASERTVFQLPEVRLGLPILWGTQRIVRIVGPAAAKELILLGKHLRADNALRLGLVHRVVPPDKLEGTTTALAEQLLKLPPRTVAIAKRILRTSFNASIRENEDQELEALSNLLTSADVREAIESFLEGRSPRFTGG